MGLVTDAIYVVYYAFKPLSTAMLSVYNCAWLCYMSSVYSTVACFQPTKNHP